MRRDRLYVLVPPLSQEWSNAYEAQQSAQKTTAAQDWTNSYSSPILKASIPKARQPSTPTLNSTTERSARSAPKPIQYLNGSIGSRAQQSQPVQKSNSPMAAPLRANGTVDPAQRARVVSLNFEISNPAAKTAAPANNPHTQEDQPHRRKSRKRPSCAQASPVSNAIFVNVEGNCIHEVPTCTRCRKAQNALNNFLACAKNVPGICVSAQSNSFTQERQGDSVQNDPDQTTFSSASTLRDSDASVSPDGMQTTLTTSAVCQSLMSGRKVQFQDAVSRNPSSTPREPRQTAARDDMVKPRELSILPTVELTPRRAGLRDNDAAEWAESPYESCGVGGRPTPWSHLEVQRDSTYRIPTSDCEDESASDFEHSNWAKKVAPPSVRQPDETTIRTRSQVMGGHRFAPQADNNTRPLLQDDPAMPDSSDTKSQQSKKLQTRLALRSQKPSIGISNTLPFKICKTPTKQGKPASPAEAPAAPHSSQPAHENDDFEPSNTQTKSRNAPPEPTPGRRGNPSRPHPSDGYENSRTNGPHEPNWRQSEARDVPIKDGHCNIFELSPRDRLLMTELEGLAKSPLPPIEAVEKAPAIPAVDGFKKRETRNIIAELRAAARARTKDKPVPISRAVAEVDDAEDQCHAVAGKPNGDATRKIEFPHSNRGIEHKGGIDASQNNSTLNTRDERCKTWIGPTRNEHDHEPPKARSPLKPRDNLFPMRPVTRSDNEDNAPIDFDEDEEGCTERDLVEDGLDRRPSVFTMPPRSTVPASVSLQNPAPTVECRKTPISRKRKHDEITSRTLADDSGSRVYHSLSGKAITQATPPLARKKYSRADSVPLLSHSERFRDSSNTNDPIVIGDDSDTSSLCSMEIARTVHKGRLKARQRSVTEYVDLTADEKTTTPSSKTRTRTRTPKKQSNPRSKVQQRPGAAAKTSANRG